MDYMIRIERALDALRETFKGTIQWIADVYDPEAGAFRFARSSWKDREKYFCAIVPACQMITALDELGLVPALPVEVKKSFISYFQGKQDPSDGLFRHKDNETFDSSVYEFQRAQLYMPDMIRILDFKPVYQSVENDQTVLNRNPHLESREKLISHLETYDWSFSENYTAASHTSTMMRTAVDSLKEPLRSELTDAFFAYVEKRQCGTTGLWCTDNGKMDHRVVSAAMKITMSYAYFNRKIPDADKVFQSVKEVILHDHNVGESYCYVRNPITTILNISSCLRTPLSEKDVCEVIEGTLKHHSEFAADKGGFLRSTVHPFTGDGGTPLSDPQLKESNCNAVSQAISAAYIPLYQLAGKEIPPLPEQGLLPELMLAKLTESMDAGNK